MKKEEIIEEQQKNNYEYHNHQFRSSSEKIKSLVNTNSNGNGNPESISTASGGNGYNNMNSSSSSVNSSSSTTSNSSGGFSRSISPHISSSTPSTSSSSSSSSPLSTSSSNIDFQFEYNPSRVHILVVDDDVIQRKILENLLKKFKYNVSVVHNGEEAWECLEKGHPKYDLVLTDVMMPEINGFDLCTRINLHPVFNKIPVILMSGTAVDYKCANDTIKIGGQDFLTKPIAKELLKKKIDTLLGSIWQKKKEMEYKSVLEKEREKGSLLAKQMKIKEHEIEELTRKVSEMASISKEAMETPLTTVARGIEELLSQSNWSKNEDELKGKLNMILKELGSSNIYRPSFEKLIKNDSIDQVTKSFLVTEFQSATNRRYSIPTFPQAPTHKDTKEFIKRWDFNVFKYSEDDLMLLLVDMFENFQLLSMFNIPLEKLQRFIMAVHSLYRKSNRYHNFIHAFDVTQTCYSFLTTFGAAVYLTHLDILSLLISAMCHDLNHPGFNNSFQVNSQSELSLIYNDVSVLENHHAMLTFKILKNSECNILEGLNEDQYKELRRSVVQLILATDMASHFEHVSKFTHHLNNQEFDRNKKEDRQMILNFLIKSGDISNVVRPWELNFEWSIRVSDEFFQQSQFEKTCGYPVAPFMNKAQTTRARIAADFIDFVALQLYQSMAIFLPESKVLIDTMTKNRQNWQAIIELTKDGSYKDDLLFISDPTLLVQKLPSINEFDEEQNKNHQNKSNNNNTNEKDQQKPTNQQNNHQESGGSES